MNLLARQPRREARWDAAAKTLAWSSAHALTSWARWVAPEVVMIVMCGKRVCDSFGFEYDPCTFGTVTGDTRARNAYCLTLVVPHPSGMNRWWNEPENVHAARRACAEALGRCFSEPMGHETARSRRHVGR